MEYNNYRIKAATGQFYQSFKEETAGAKPVTFKDKNTGQDITRYHRTQNNVGGTLRSVVITEPPFGGKWLRIEFQEDENTRGNITVPLLNNGIIDDWARAAALSMANWEIGKDYQFGLNKKNKDKNGYLYKNLYVSIPTGPDTGDNVPWALDPKTVPPLEQAPDEITGELKWNGKARTKFYYDYILAQVARLAPDTDPGPDTEVKASDDRTDFGPDEGVAGGEYDLLPF